MRRWTIPILVCVVLGAVVNVAVAWACAWTLPIYQWDLQAQGRTNAAAEDWYFYVADTPGRRYIMARSWAWKQGHWWDEQPDRFLSQEETDALPGVLLPRGPPQPDGLRERLYSAAGFPFLSMSCFADAGLDGSISPRHSLVARYEESPLGLEYIRFDLIFRAFPLRPLWGGMILNTLTYAIASYLVASFIGFLHRRVCRTLPRTLAACNVIGFVIGVITTVFVAWWYAYFVELSSHERATSGAGWTELVDQPTGIVWSHMTLHRAHSGAEEFHSIVGPSAAGVGTFIPDGPAAEFLPTWTDSLTPKLGVELNRRADARGWPMLAMWTAIDEVWTNSDGGNSFDRVVVHHGLMLPRHDLDGEMRDYLSRYLPLAPIWPGFLVDTLFYGAIWCVLLFMCLGRSPIRRAVRRRRGRCVSCGYDLQGAFDAGCPECGWGRDEETTA